MNRQKPDRIPVMCQMSLGHLLLISKISPVDLYTTVDGFTSALLYAREKYHFDGILVNLVPLECDDPEWKSRVNRIMKTDEGEIIYWKNGSRTLCPWDDSPRNLTDSHTKDDECTPIRIDPSEVPVSPERYRTLKKVITAAGSEFSIHSEISSSFTSLISRYGLERFLLELSDNPLTCSKALEADTLEKLKLVDLQAREEIDAMVISSAFAGRSLISRRFTAGLWLRTKK